MLSCCSPMPLSSECRPPTPDVSGGNLMVVDYVVRAQWSNTYIVDVTATLNCAAARRRSERFGVANWDLEFTLLAGHRISRFWNAAVHQDGAKRSYILDSKSTSNPELTTTPAFPQL